MNISTSFPSTFLKAGDLKGQTALVSMESVVLEKVGDDEKPVLYFRGKDKGVVLNKTNSQMISASYGDETDNWVGQPLEIYPDKTSFKGDIVDCIRVRVPAPAAAEGEEAPF